MQLSYSEEEFQQKKSPWTVTVSKKNFFANVWVAVLYSAKIWYNFVLENHNVLKKVVFKKA